MRRTGDVEPSQGVTLLELLVVLGMISVLLGLGLGVFGSLDRNLQGRVAAERVKSMVRRARNTAVRTGSEAWLLLEPEKRRVTGAGAAVVGQWHLEDATSVRGGPLFPSGGEFRDDGRFGRCLDFGDGGGFVQTEGQASFDPRQGFLVEVYLLATSRRAMTVLELGGSYSLLLDDRGGLRAEIRQKEGPVVGVDSPDLGLPLHRWIRLGLLSDARRVSVLVDGVEVASSSLESPIAFAPGAVLAVGSGAAPIRGRVDELRLFSLGSREVFELKGDVQLLGASRLIAFDRGGKLSQARHSGPETIQLDTPGGMETLEVGLLGSVR